jgi:uncharacterized SAM-binding protein YcdF (DUF218 family)
VYTLSKILQPLLWPYNIGLTLLLFSACALLIGRARSSRYFLVAAICVLVFPSLPFIAMPLLSSLESQYPPLSLTEVQPADAIVVFGGTVLGIDPPRKQIQESDGSRVFGAWRLFRAKKAPFIVVTSGVSYQDAQQNWRTEADDMRDLLVELGVPSHAILLENRARNTSENAAFSRVLLDKRGFRRVILVTSAFHLPRSVAMLRKQKFTEIQGFPTDTRGTERRFSPLDFLPSLGALQKTTCSIKEYIGLWVYR